MSEEHYVTPAAWQRSILPRRGGLPVPHRPAKDAAAVVAAALEQPPAPRRKLAWRETPDDIRAAGLAALDDPSGATPLGAAAVAVTAVGPSASWNTAVSAAFADHWIATRGLAFAVRTGVELADLWHPGVLMTFHGGGIGPLQIRRFGASPRPVAWAVDGTVLVLRRLRAAMAAAPDAEHAAAVAALGAARAEALTAPQLAATSFLAPTERDWVEHDTARFGGPADDWSSLLLAAAVTEPRQLTPMLAGTLPFHLLSSAVQLHTLGEGLGADGLQTCLDLLAVRSSANDATRTVLSLVAAIPTDAAFQTLLDRLDGAAGRHVRPILLEAAERFPRRAMRMLPAGELLRTHLAKHRDLVDEVLPGLTGAAAERVAAITARLDGVREAPAEALPPLLSAPPWAAGGKARKPIVVAGLACADDTVLDWAPGERETWLRHNYAQSPHAGRDHATTAEEIRSGRVHRFDASVFFALAPDELARPVLPHWRPTDLWAADDWLRPVVARFGTAAAPVVLAAARREPAGVAPVLAPFTGPEVAALIAEWFGRLKSVRPVAAAWLRRHPAAAARALVPPALGKPGAARRQAEQALLAVAAAGHRETVLGAAAGYGEPAAAAIAALLDTDPVELLPARMPVVPDWADPAALAPVELRGGAGSLPAAAAGHVLTMLALSRLGEPYAGLAVVRDAGTPESLAEFAWSLFQCWQRAGAPAKEGWVLDALGLLGDDTTVRRLAPVIRAWPGEGGHTRAVAGLDVLAGIGTDVALMHLHGIAESARFKGLKERAQAKIAEVATALGLSPEQLADRLVPGFGLDASGTLLLDYGPRRFTVGFDEQLKPFVADEDGKRRKDLPKPGAKDDPALAPAAAQRFASLKKDVRVVAADQIRRFEQAMVRRRRWSGAAFRQFIVGHPLVWHLARRLVWGTYDAAGALTGAVRVAEDRSLADLDDKAVELADDALVGIAHPVRLGAALTAWAEVFADYEILQPFPQLGRETFALTGEEREASRLTRFAGTKVPTAKVVGLERRGWRRADPEDAGMQPWVGRDLPGGAVIVLDLSPGIAVGDITAFGEQTLGALRIVGPGESHRSRADRHPLDELDPVTASETIRDLQELTA